MGFDTNSNRCGKAKRAAPAAEVGPSEWLMTLAGQLVSEFRDNIAFKEFTGNPDLVGAYAEAAVRRLIRKVVFPLRVSNGAIIYEKVPPGEVKQLDVIIWSPNPVPAVFEVGDFALIPRGSAWAFLEVKNSCYPGVAEKLEDRLNLEDGLLREFWPDGIKRLLPKRSALGVVCVQKADQSDAELGALVKAGRVVILLRHNKKKGQYDVDAHGVWTLINFLAAIRRFAAQAEGLAQINLSVVSPP